MKNIGRKLLILLFVIGMFFGCGFKVVRALDVESSYSVNKVEKINSVLEQNVLSVSLSKTSDDVIWYVIVGSVSFVALIIAIIWYKKINE